MPRPRCLDCGAELQEARLDGDRYLRCPWAHDWTRRPVVQGGIHCDWPYRRSEYVR